MAFKGKFIEYDKGGDEDIEGVGPKLFRHSKGGSEKIVGLGGGLRKSITSTPKGGGGGEGLLKN